MVSVFENHFIKDAPYSVSIVTILERIQTGDPVGELVRKIRATKSKDERGKLKAQLPCICFSGTFKTRRDEDVIEHSGYAILDFDKVAVSDTKRVLSSLDFIYAIFTSPSGNGVKALARIPANIEKHEGHYLALLKELENIGLEADPANKNISRICYESYDPDLFIDELASEFTGYIEIPKKPKVEPRLAGSTDYSKLSVPANMIRNAGNGEKHDVLLKASRLAGGLIAGGFVEEPEAVRVLEREISKKDIGDFKNAQKTIIDAIENGKTDPITDEVEWKEDTDFEYIRKIRNGTLEIGKRTGLNILDYHWRFKRNHLVVVNGHDNVGKSQVIWYLAVNSAKLHGWRWMIYSSENSTGYTKARLMSFYSEKMLDKMSDKEFELAYNFIRDHFIILTHHDKLYSYGDILNIAKSAYDKKPFDALIVDPYNSLYVDKNKLKGLTTHDYHYEAMTNFRMFKEKYCSVYLICHAVTEALRKTYSKEHIYYGHPIPPSKADTEGGGKFANRADDFLTIHRLVQHVDRYRITEIHVRKIKEIETGGRHTLLNEPVEIEMTQDGAGFKEISKLTNIINGKAEAAGDSEKAPF
jgi:hypothetical protein